MINQRRWSQEEDQFLRDNYETLGRAVCAERLGRYGETIYDRAKFLGITKKRRSVVRINHKPRPDAKPSGEPGLPVAQSDFIRPLTKARLMGGRA